LRQLILKNTYEQNLVWAMRKAGPLAADELQG